ncbi:MAG: carboxypeptidase-like regulatory domain-containing protein, partial [Melioribacteraceae bacterium]|nr:carboxypeptidase-like regulatory domain-containing protein [Melioribacteraceae bacterium]
MLSGAKAQQITGLVTDEDDSPVASALISLTDQSFRMISYTESDSAGMFSLQWNGNTDRNLIIRHLNFHPDTIDMSVFVRSLKIRLRDKKFHIDEVYITSKRLPYIQKNDTTRFLASAFADSTELTVEQLLAKLPGVRIDDSGIIRFRGKTVSRVLLEDEDLFGNKYTLGTKSMSPKYVEEFEFVDNYTEEELYKNIKNSNDLVLNLKLSDKAKLSVFGTIETGVGIQKKYLLNNNLFSLAGRYKAALFNQKNNIGFRNFNLIQHLDQLQNFDQLTYNRSNFPLVFATPTHFEGITRDLQANSD